MTPALEQALVGLAASLSTLSIAVAAHWAKKKYDVKQVERGEKERRKEPRNGYATNGNGSVCVLAKGPMPDSALPRAAHDYYEGTTAILREIAETLKENRDSDAVHRQQEIHALKTLTLLQVKAAEKMGITITPSDLERL